MAYVIMDACQDEKSGECVTICPVDCIEEGSDQYYIDPDACIDCGACVAACPVSAIVDENDLPAEQEGQLEKAEAFFG
ncbi:4Fe-4S dicluster domain-containing protein [Salicibibacter halophilus]|uniref:Ferredoxin n=1 Tax=Salicibibacter halophilus TaxID=2502791 RepID=A0A514LM69_9BACI|nr:4Fe-4S dicluster domain-containing protein [Salicibibacter halophilus]QDI92351.1 4Fe-4S dicluster domain-containing protein [Salicibibacter halophilus]